MMAHISQAPPLASAPSHEGVGAQHDEEPDASFTSDAWRFTVGASPLVGAWLVAEKFFDGPSFSGNILAFAITWAIFELLLRGTLRLTQLEH
jgi:hypothetical protein